MPPKRSLGGAAKRAAASRNLPESESSNAAQQGLEVVNDTELSAPPTNDPNSVASEPGEASAVTVDDSSSTAQGEVPSSDVPTSSTPAQSSSQRGRGRGSAAAPRARKPFAPKVTTRRSQAERDSLSATEAVKQAERDRDYAAKKAEQDRKQERLDRMKRGWDNNKRGRGRGGFMGDKRSAVSGPFSQGYAEGKVKYHVPHSRSGAIRGEHRAGGGARIKTEDGGSGSSRRAVQHGDDDGVMEDIKEEDGGYISSGDEDAGGLRRDVDAINLVSDDEEDDGRRERASSMRPVRLRRTEHRDRRTGVTTETGAAAGDGDFEDDMAENNEADRTAAAATSKSKGKTKSKEVEFVGENRLWQGAWNGDEDAKPHIKEEPVDDVEMTTAPPVLRPQSPDQSRKGAKEKGRASTKTSGGKKKPPMMTEEEQQEWNRYQDDLETLVAELGHVDMETEGEAEDGDIRSKSETVYLFQFPPVLPKLRRASENVKPDPEAAPSSPQQTKRATTVAPKTDPENPVKVEDDAPGTAPNRSGEGYTSGSLGKLRVHRSGKVTLDYGGTSLQLNKGLDASFLQDAVITKLPEAGIPGLSGEAFALGPVKGKFVITPDWDAVVG